MTLNGLFKGGLFKGKKSDLAQDVSETNTIDSDDVHEKYAKAISLVLLREMGNTPRMQQLRERLMMAIKSV